MIIIYGVKAKHLSNGVLKNVHCPHCNADADMRYSVYGRYAHVFLIPFMKSGKTAVTECDNCKKTYDLRKLPKPIKEQFRNRDKHDEPRLSAWYNTGLIVALLLITAAVSVGIWEGHETDKKIKAYLHDPKQGDVYHISFERGHYSTLKVDRITADSVELFINSMETNLYSGIEQIDIPDNYTKSRMFSKQELNKMREDEVIYQITRK